MPEFIYQMRAVRKAHGDKVILDNVTLAFLPGAKIGVVGPNGMGKSTLLRMMAGVEQPSNGDARLMPGFTVGLLAQELVEVRGDRLVERQEPDRGLPLRAVVAVECVEHLLRGPSWTEDLVQQGSRLLIEGKLAQRFAGSIADAGGFECGGGVNGGERQ